MTKNPKDTVKERKGHQETIRKTMKKHAGLEAMTGSYELPFRLGTYLRHEAGDAHRFSKTSIGCMTA